MPDCRNETFLLFLRQAKREEGITEEKTREIRIPMSLIISSSPI